MVLLFFTRLWPVLLKAANGRDVGTQKDQKDAIGNSEESGTTKWMRCGSIMATKAAQFD